MRKHLISLLALAFTTNAFPAEVKFSYNPTGLEPEGFGYKKEQTYSIAVALNSPEVIGKQIVGFSVPVYDSEYVSDVSAWLSAELNALKGTPSSFTPDVASYEATVTDGMISVSLPEPYTIPDDGIFLGYSFTIGGWPEGQSVNPVAVVPGTTNGGLWIHASESQVKWVELPKRKEYVSPMVVTLSGDFQANAADIYADSKKAYAAKGEQSQAKVIIENWGTDAIASFDYTYTLAGTTTEGSYKFETPIPAILGRRATAEIELNPIATLGDYECTISLSRVNGADNGMAAKDVTLPLTVQPFVAEYRPLVEEFTGLRCGWCPRGYVMLEQMKLCHGDKFVGMAYHDSSFENGAMVYISSSDYPVHPSGLPAASFNRGGTTDPSSIPGMWENSQSVNTPAEIAVDLQWADETQTKLVANGKARFVYDIPESDYLLSFALVADGLSNEKWGQSNAYADYEATGDYTGPYWDLFVGKDSPVYGLTYNDVVVYYPDVNGIEESLPSSIEAEKWYEYTFEVDIDKVKNLAGENNVNDFNKTRVIAIVVNKNGGKPLNCISSLYPDGSAPIVDGVETVEVENPVVDTVFYNLQGQLVSNPDKGLYIKVDRYSDGSSNAVKVIF